MDFNQLVERRGTNSYKWDQSEQLFGSQDVLPMWVADMDFHAPEAVRNALAEQVQHGVFGYSVKPPSHDEAVRGWLSRRHGFEVPQEWLVSCPTVLTAIALLLEMLTEPGDGVIVQTPVYHAFFNVIRSNGRAVVENPLRETDGRYEMDYEDLEQKLKNGAKALLLCSPHNPVGRVWTREELQIVGELCLKYNVPVISDEIHFDLVLEGHRHTMMASLSDEVAQNTITCFSITKTFNLAGIHTSTLIIPNDSIRRRLTQRLQALSLASSSPFATAATEAAYNGGEAWLEGLLAHVKGNYEFLVSYLQAHLPEIKAAPLEATYLVWLDFRALGKSPQDLQDWLYREAKVALNAGDTFGTGGEGFLRMNIACPRATLEEGLRRLSKARSR